MEPEEGVMRTVRTVAIGKQLCLESTPLGVTLNYYEPAKALHFRVGMSHQSLIECDKALMRGDKVFWTLADKSLSISGDDEELTLVFSSLTAPLIQSSLALNDRELRAFQYAMEHFSGAAWIRLN